MDGLISTANPSHGAMFNPSNYVGTKKPITKQKKFSEMFKTLKDDSRKGSGWELIKKNDKILREKEKDKKHLKLGGEFRIPTLLFTIN